MARKDYPPFAAEIVAAVGGKENIVSVTHCMTRLRFVLADESIVKDDEVKKINGVMGVVHGGGQYQIPIGTQVADLCPEVEKLLGGVDPTAAAKTKAESMRVVSKDSWYNRFFKAISGCIIPSIAPMAAGGIIKGVLTILTTFGVLATTDGTYMIFYAAADALMYFFPIIIGFSAGKVFGMNPYTAACLGAAMLYPNLAAFVGAETPLTFFGIPVTMLAYQQTILPILGLTVWALAGVSLGYALRVKNKELKATAFGAMASALCGITEPTIYTVALTNFKRFIAAFIGGGIAGIIGGALGLKFYTMAGDGLFRIPGMINPAGLDISFYGFLLCAAIAFVASGAIAFLVTDPNEGSAA